MDMNSFHKVVEAELGRIHGEVVGKQVELQARLSELEKKAARRPSGGVGNDGPLDRSGLASELAATEGFQALRRGLTREFRFEIPAAGFRATLSNDGNTLGTTAPMPGLLIAPGMRRATIRDLLPAVPTTSSATQYARETDFTNSAGPVSETLQKAESTLSFELKTAPAITIAHWVHASKQVLDDVALLQDYLGTRLRYGLMLSEESQLLNGSGIGNNVEGLYTLATAYSAPAGVSVTAEQRLDRLRIAIAQLAASNYIANGIVLNPIDWASIELLKETTTLAYLWAKPQIAASPALWGLPVIVTNAQTQDTALVGDFRTAAVLLDRESARIDIALEDQDDFVRNMCKIRVEERIGLAVRLPQALIKVADLSP